MSDAFVALHQQDEITITCDAGTMVLRQANWSRGDDPDQIAFDPRHAPRLAATILEASGYHNVEFVRRLGGGLMYTDLDLSEPPDDENPHLIEALAERERLRESARQQAERPDEAHKDSTNAERQRRYRQRRKAKPVTGDRNAASVTPDHQANDDMPLLQAAE